MIVKIKLFATLREGRFPVAERQFNAGVTVRGVLAVITIREAEVALILINGRHKDFETVLADGDTLSLFPPIGGG